MTAKRPLQIKTDAFVLGAFFYSVASFLGFVMTSSGWTAFLFYGLFGALVFGANGLFLITVLLIKKPEHLRIPMKGLLLLVLVQLVALLLNIGDYGDSAGSRSYFEVLLGRSHFLCRGNDCNMPPLLGDWAANISFAGVVLYLIVLLLLDVWILRGLFRSSEQKKP
jgi:hypothetical protein